jgi:hypothetical protein
LFHNLLSLRHLHSFLFHTLPLCTGTFRTDHYITTSSTSCTSLRFE